MKIIKSGMKGPSLYETKVGEDTTCTPSDSIVCKIYYPLMVVGAA